MLDLTFLKNNLVAGINIAMKAVPTRTSLPILECFLLEAKEGRVTLTANDMEMAIKTTLNAEVAENGKVAIDAKLFSEIVRKMPEEEVRIEVTESLQVKITSGKTHFEIPGKDGGDFVDMPSMEKGTPIVVSQMTLKDIIEETIFSIAPNENNKMMTGELFEINNNVLRVAALDGHRIAIRYSVLQDYYEKKAVIVPGKTLNDISRILSGDASKNVSIYMGRNNILFEFEDTVLMSRLIEGEYFRINQMISDNYETKLIFNRRELLECIERSVLLVRESDKKPLILDIKDEGTKLTLNSVIGSMKEELQPEKEGKDLLIGFNPRFLIDALRAVSDEKVNLYLSNSRAPGYIRDDEGTYIYLILPVNFVTR
ncbi:MAG: DNA polymerase III subunit beta [Lachnospiraceae bacterium]|nr:DNA polymerase III subunit beta [Lachnospiraceae bacterium]MBQ6195983.1 DNA polymerase III subunit beta [Lachnospiraceae bacterium]